MLRVQHGKLGRTVGTSLRFCSRFLSKASLIALVPVLRMLPALNAKVKARWVQRGLRSVHARSTALTVTVPVTQNKLSPDTEAVIRSIHGTKTKAVVYVTGGAVQSISWLLSVPGASATVLEASVPYARDSMVDLLGKEPSQFCSASTAIAMAEAAYRRAANLCDFGSHFVGLGATCALATDLPKKGEHRAFVAVHGATGSRCVALTLAKGARSRMEEDDLASRVLVKLLAEASGSDTSAFQLPLLQPPGSEPSPPSSSTAASASTVATAEPSAASTSAATAAANGGSGETSGADSHPYDVLQDTWRAANDPLGQLLRGEVRCVEFCGQEVVVDAPRRGRVYLPGSFNPLHEGHRQLLASAVEAASAATGTRLEGAFELTVENADKGMLEEAEIRRRVAQFVALGLPVVITRAPLFTLKSDLLPDSRFVVGYDTVARLVLPKYYGNSYTQMVVDFARLRLHGCSFVVAGRKDANSGRFMSLEDVEMPPELADLFPVELPETAFRLDISSTELRKQQAQQQQQ